MKKTLLKAILLASLLSTSASVFAAPYPLGTMTCEEVGKFASEAMAWREKGLKRDEAMAKLEARTFNDPVEKQNLEGVLRMVFGRYGDSWTQESAGNVIRSDCQAGR